MEVLLICFCLINQFLQEEHGVREAVSGAILRKEETRGVHNDARSIGILLRGRLRWIGVG